MLAFPTARYYTNVYISGSPPIMSCVESSFRRRRLPHYDIANATYFITACLAGSVPARGLLRGIDAGDPRGSADDWLDSSSPVRWCADRRIAAIVRDAIEHFEGERYVTLAYVVMPSHFHWVFQPIQDWHREMILKSVKSYTARACNRVLHRGGAFWQAESFDRVIRNERECEQIVDYVEFNPVKAGLCQRPEQWRFSSACKRK
jgi:REP element-mobilizing transposase RayT